MSGSQQLLLGGAPQVTPVDPFFYSVTSLLHGDGTNGAQNNTFLDSSTNNFTITRNGNTTQGSFSPFSQTGWSWYFDGTGDTLSWSGTTLSGDFTVECWVYKTAVDASGYTNVFSSSSENTQFAIDNTTAGSIALIASATTIIAPSGTAVTPNVWHHLAWVREGSTCRAYVNGVQQGTGTSSGSINLSLISRFQTSGYEMNGYISNARIVSGTCLYPSGTTFTPPTTPLTAISGTQLLVCQSNRFRDASTNNFAITRNGDVSVQPFSPFNPLTPYSTSAVGGSGYFDGSGDTLTAASNSAFSFGSGDLTVEAWIYRTASGTFPIFTNGAAAGGSFAFYIVSDVVRCDYYLGTSLAGTTTVPLNAWTHVAVTRSGSNLNVYLNGVRDNTTTTSSNNTSNSLAIGRDWTDGSAYATGFISSLRVLKGSAQYTGATYTVPTAPLTAIANTSLLLDFTNAGIFDNAAVADYETVGNAQISTSVKKYGTGSMSFDGTGDYLTIPYNQFINFGTGDFTIEGWFYLNSFANQYYVLGGTWTTGTSDEWLIQIENNGSLRFLTTANTSFFATGLIKTGTWYHFAASRNAGVIKAYINGTAFATIANTNSIGSTSKVLNIGQQPGGTWPWNGYVDDWRISKGIGRYPYNFTPPTAELPNIGGTVTLTADPYYEYTTLLLPGNGTNGAQNNTFLDSSTNAFSITRNGNTTQGTFSPFSQTGWGNFFDGTSGQYLNAPANAAFNFGTGDFTVEAWVYPTSTSGTRPIVEIRTSAPNSTGFALLSQSGATTLNVYTNGGFAGASTGSITTNQWNHVALTRSGNTWTYWINGTSSGSFTNSSTQSDGATTGPKIAGSTTAGEIWVGYLSNVRIVKGTAVYTTNFTPSTAPLTAISGTSLLTCQSNRFVDNSSNAFAITVNGSPSVQAFSPFNPTAAWSAATYGGSGYYDGAGDYLRLAYTSALQFTGNFTIEFWAYPLTQASAFAGVFNNYSSWPSSTGVSIFCGHSSAGTTKWVVALFGTFPAIQSSADYIKNAWSHIALVRNGTGSNNITLYINGVSAGTFTSNNTVTGTADYWWVGTTGDAVSTQNFTGYLADFRATGSAVYTGTFTPPTAPLTAISNTQLLLAGTNAGIYDATSKNDLETVGNAQISTTQSKFGGSSMYFDGTGDYLSIPATQNIVFGTADFTIEMWVYSGSQGSTGARMFGNGAGAAWGSGKYILTTTTAANPNKFTLGINNASPADVLVSTTTFNDSTWKHVAITRYNGVFRLFVNGILESTNTTNVSVDNGTAAQIRIGSSGISGDADWAGYIDDLRITKGIARYTSNFTPPTAAFLTL